MADDDKKKPAFWGKKDDKSSDDKKDDDKKSAPPKKKDDKDVNINVKTDNGGKSKKDKKDSDKKEPEKIAGKGTNNPSKYIDVTPTIDYSDMVKKSVNNYLHTKGS